MRRERRIKLPDAIILATAEIENRLLITRNTRDFPAGTVLASAFPIRYKPADLHFLPPFVNTAWMSFLPGNSATATRACCRTNSARTDPSGRFF